MKRLSVSALALALALALPGQAEAQSRTVCLTISQATCVQFSGVTWGNATGGYTYSFSTLRFFGSTTLPAFAGLWWNQADANGDETKIGWYGDASGWGTSGAWDSGNLAASGDFWLFPPTTAPTPTNAYGSYSGTPTGTNGGGFAAPGTTPYNIAYDAGDADVVTVPGQGDVKNGFSLFQLFYSPTNLADCVVQAPTTFLAPDGTEAPVLQAGLFAWFQTDCYNSTESTTVPEPAAMALLASTLAGLGFIGRRRRKDLIEDDQE